MEDTPWPYLAVFGGAMAMLLVAPKLILFIAGFSAVVWGLNIIYGD